MAEKEELLLTKENIDQEEDVGLHSDKIAYIKRTFEELKRTLLNFKFLILLTEASKVAQSFLPRGWLLSQIYGFFS